LDWDTEDGWILVVGLSQFHGLLVVDWDPGDEGWDVLLFQGLNPLVNGFMVDGEDPLHLAPQFELEGGLGGLILFPINNVEEVGNELDGLVSFKA